MRNSGGSCKCIEEIVFAVIPAKAGIQKPALEGLNRGSLVLKNTGFPIKTSGMTNKDFCKNLSGFTLIELLVVIGIIGVLAISLGFSFVGWQGRYRVESAIKQVESDLMKARSTAMQHSRAHFFTLDSVRRYTVYEDNNPAPDGDGSLQTNADTVLPSYPKTIDYDMTWNGVGTTVNFDRRGLISPNRTICMFTDFDGDTVSDVNPDYDCVVISATRINLGKLRIQNTAGGLCKSYDPNVPGEGGCEQR